MGEQTQVEHFRNEPLEIRVEVVAEDPTGTLVPHESRVAATTRYVFQPLWW